MSTRSAKKQIEELMTAVGAKTKTDLARALGITSPAIHIAISKGKVPPRWSEQIKQRGKGVMPPARRSNGKPTAPPMKASVPAPKTAPALSTLTNGVRTGGQMKDALRNIGRGLQQMGRGIEQLADSLAAR